MTAFTGGQAFPDLLRSIDSSTFTGSYQALGTALDRPIRVVKIVNNSTKDVTISWNTQTDHDFIPAGGFTLYDFNSNKSHFDSWLVSQGTQFYIKGSAGTGSVYLVCIGS